MRNGVRKTSDATIEEARECFEQWRAQGAKKRIPDELWAMAIAAARHGGVNRTAHELHLDGGKLKRLMVAADAAKAPTRPASPPPTFVELVAPQPTRSREFVLEAQSRRGTLVRIRMHGADTRELVEFSRALLDLA